VLGHLEEELGKKGRKMVKIDILNEVSWLKDIDKTPTFMVFSKKKGTFRVVDTQNRKIGDENDS
jgi:hypothetical protein